MRNHYRLNTANIEISGNNRGSDPKNIVKYAKDRFKEEKKANNSFNEVYCVFDKDSHSNYYEAIDEIKNSTPKNTFFAITSVPCFEYWLLLHFEYTTRPYSKQNSKNSSSLEVINQLKNYIPNYNKRNNFNTKEGREIFEKLLENMDTAICHAERALKEVTASETDNPSTKVHTLVEILTNLNKNSSK